MSPSDRFPATGQNSLRRLPDGYGRSRDSRDGDGEKVTRNAPHRADTHVDHRSARPTSSSRQPDHRPLPAVMTNRNAHFEGYQITPDADQDRSRSRSRSRSPYRHDRSRSRSPYRADREQPSRDKRRHPDDHYGKGSSDPRRHRIAYADRPTPRGSGIGYGSAKSYSDIDRPGQRSPGLPYNDPGAFVQSSNKRERSRSRSPYRASRDNNARPSSRQSNASFTSSPDTESKTRGNTSAAQREFTPRDASKESDTKINPSQSEQQMPPPNGTNKARSVTPAESVVNCKTNDTLFSDDTEEVAAPESKLSEAEIIERRRKARQAIRKKYAAASGNDSLLRTTLESSLPSTPATPIENDRPSPPSSVDSPATPSSPASPASPASLAPIRDEDLANPLQPSVVPDDQGQSAADYDPNEDMNEDRPDHKRQDMEGGNEAAAAKPEAPVKAPDDFDMFADDDVDMFAAEDPPSVPAPAKQGRALDESMLDNWDYPDGHYKVINGELLGGRYAVEQQVGKGTFATVVRARDADTGNKVAIKIACKNDTMLKAGQKEMQFLERLNERDPDDKRFVIRLLGNFTHKGHLCLVFEGLHMDLREVLKKFGRDVGINIEAVRIYACQMFHALVHMKNAEVLHADLKPDNILVNEKRTMIKVCDFGTATLIGDTELTPYLVSRFYRAPEVILGMEFDYAIDMWAIGCTLYEMYVGRILFNGADNNNMLRVIQECRGKLPNRLIKRAQLANKYFDDTFTFHALEKDKITGNTVLRPTHFSQGITGKDLKSRLNGNLGRMAPAQLKDHHLFVDLLDKCLQLDPEKRIKPNEALKHPFIRGPIKETKGKAGIGASTPLFRPTTLG